MLPCLGRQRGPMGALEERKRVEVDQPVAVNLGTTARVEVTVRPWVEVGGQVGGRHTVAQDTRGRGS